MKLTDTQITDGGLVSLGVDGGTPQAAREAQPAKRGRIAHPRRPPARTRRGVSLSNRRPKRAAAHRSRTACWQCSSASRAQPSLLS